MRKRILIVEDDLDTSTMIKEYLEESFEITSVPDGDAALAILNKDEFDIVIPGLESAKTFRSASLSPLSR